MAWAEWAEWTFVMEVKSRGLNVTEKERHGTSENMSSIIISQRLRAEILVGLKCKLRVKTCF